MENALTLSSVLVNITVARHYFLHVNMLNTSELVLVGLQEPTIAEERRWVQQIFCDSKQLLYGKKFSKSEERFIDLCIPYNKELVKRLLIYRGITLLRKY
jgi:hypothetical protein